MAFFGERALSVQERSQNDACQWPSIVRVRQWNASFVLAIARKGRRGSLTLSSPKTFYLDLAPYMNKHGDLTASYVERQNNEPFATVRPPFLELQNCPGRGLYESFKMNI